MGDAEIKYKKLAEKVREMLDAQQAYFKSRKDFQLLRKSKALEAEVREMLNPKPANNQAQFEFLAR